MFANLVLAAALARKWMPGVPDADLVTCPPNHHFPPPPHPFLPPDLPAASAQERLRRTTTRVSDSIEFPMHGTTWFQSWAGGGGAGAFAAYDTSTGVYATCGYQDTAHDLQYRHVPPAQVPRQIPRNALGINLETAHGIHFGDTIGDVEAVYGYTKPARVNRTTLYFRSGRLIGVDRVAGI